MEAVRDFVIRNQARFEKLGGDDAGATERVPLNRAGWIKQRDGVELFLVPGEVWRGEVLVGLDPVAGAAALRRRGHLIPQSESDPRHVRVEKVNGKSMKLYVVSSSILADGEDDDAR